MENEHDFHMKVTSSPDRQITILILANSNRSAEQNTRPILDKNIISVRSVRQESDRFITISILK
jgi:hypothetical protein